MYHQRVSPNPCYGPEKPKYIVAMMNEKNGSEYKLWISPMFCHVWQLVRMFMRWRSNPYTRWEQYPKVFGVDYTLSDNVPKTTFD